MSKISDRELAQLRSKAEAHDRMLTALRQMRLREVAVTRERDEQRTFYDTAPDWARNGLWAYVWSVGWLACWTEMNRTIVAAPAPQPEEGGQLQPELPF